MLTPGNIWSGSKTLAMFTNPTELAFKKGNLKYHYPIEFRGQFYVDAEDVYQKNKNLYIPENRIFLMSMILIEKLKQHDNLFKLLKESGGVSFIEKCDHIVYNNSCWEGKGRESQFIRCLIAAYRNVENEY